MVEWNEWIIWPRDHNPYKNIWFWFTLLAQAMFWFVIIGLLNGWIP